MATTADIAIVGATTAVGEAMLEFLGERELPVDRLYLLDQEQSAGTKLEFRDRYITVEPVEAFDFSQVRLVLFTNGPFVEQVARAAAEGAVVIDGSGGFIDDPDVPAVVAEVNPERLADYGERGIVACPGSLAVMLAVALKPIVDAAGIERINVATYQSVSRLGKEGVEELAGQTARLLNAQDTKPKVFPRQIAFNVLPQVGQLLENGYSEEEMRLVRELRKVLGDEQLMVNATAVHVPVFYGYAAAVHIETETRLTAVDAVGALEKASGLKVLDDKARYRYPTPVTEANQQDEVFLGRIREDISHPRGLNFWVVADNVRKGAALNSVLLAELLVRDYL